MFATMIAGIRVSRIFRSRSQNFPLETRGRVMGVVQTAFSASQVLGIPTGLYIANLWNWHAAFLMIALIAIPVGLVIAIYMKPVIGHLALKQSESPWRHLTGTVMVPQYAMAFVTTSLAVTCSCRLPAPTR
jgi:predicted MFS family arabinose efflux permease